LAQANAFQGRLEDFGLVELLQAMNLDGQSGALHLRADAGGSGIVYFDNGAIVGAQEYDREALTLGHVLQQLQFASQQQVDYVFRMQTQDALGKRIGARLVEHNFISEQQLERALRTQALWTIRELALWRHGAYTFRKGEHMPDDAVAPRTETSAAAMEALRYQHERDMLEFVLPDGMRTFLMMAPQPDVDYPMQFHPLAWRIISRVNSQHTVRRIATSLRMPELEVARMAGKLVQDGLLLFSRTPGAPGRPEVATRINLQRFDLFSLIITMNQSWLKCRTEVDRLVALARFINETMEALADNYRASDVALAHDTLAIILDNAGIVGIGEHRFAISNNRIDLDDLAAYCRSVLDTNSRSGDTAHSQLFIQFREELLRALASAFRAINTRITSPEERVQNQDVWESLFEDFRS